MEEHAVSIPLPPFTFTLIGAAAAVFILCVVILLAAKNQHDEHNPLSALVSFALPFASISIVFLIIPSIGSLLLTVGKVAAVPVALVLALIILIVCAAVAGKGESSQSGAHH